MNLRIGVVCGLAMMLLPGIGSRSPTAAAAEAKAEFVPAERQRVIVLTDTSVSPHVKLRSVNIDAVRWTDGFWAERFDWCRKVVIPNMWRLLADPNISHAYENLVIAAGYRPGPAPGAQMERRRLLQVARSYGVRLCDDPR